MPYVRENHLGYNQFLDDLAMIIGAIGYIIFFVTFFFLIRNIIRDDKKKNDKKELDNIGVK
jgi:hypothetical protein